ncbi:hypothetical protein E5288_WYG006180 [Bos mutus]|uniref:Uncharacterized protein n=1 Tax=Bos mutus TaxID=72004 RepID=A0A6B0QYG1_9CETA|nr:hypothetical protein [Bos mutus]
MEKNRSSTTLLSLRSFSCWAHLESLCSDLQCLLIGFKHFLFLQLLSSHSESSCFAQAATTIVTSRWQSCAGRLILTGQESVSVKRIYEESRKALENSIPQYTVVFRAASHVL